LSVPALCHKAIYHYKLKVTVRCSNGTQVTIIYKNPSKRPLNRFIAPWAMRRRTLDEVRIKTIINHKKDKDLMISEITRVFISEK